MSTTSLYFRAPLFADGRVVAGFSTRRGGDDPRGLACAAGFSLSRLYMVSQVHGAAVVEIAGDERPEDVHGMAADALVTDVPGVALAVRTADCVPVLIAASDGCEHRVAAVHAGWRGLVAGVIRAAVATIASGGVEVARLTAAIGPAIDACCFEVQPAVAEAIAEATKRRDVVVDRGPASRPHVDLRAAALYELLAAGVARDRVAVVGPCTRCAASELHSYRREGGGQGRQLSFIVIGDR